MTCANPIPRDQFVAYWLEELDEAEAEALEEHAFECDTCAVHWRKASELVTALSERVPPTFTRATIERYERSGQRLLHTTIPEGSRATVPFGPDVDLLVHRLPVDLSGVERLDCEVVNAADDSPIIAFSNVVFERARNEVNLVCQRHYAENFPPDARIDLIAVGPSGRSVVARFGVLHVVQSRA